MAHYVIESEQGSGVYSAWSEDDAIESHYDAFGIEWTQHGEWETPVTIRPATVREALVAEYGENWSAEDYRSGLPHVVTVVANYRTEHKPILVINDARANDVHGYDDAVYVSNYRVLEDRWSELDGFSRGPWSNVDAIALDLDSEAPADLTEVIDALEGYPVIDEQAWSEVEQEMIQEDWDSYGEADVTSAVSRALGNVDLTDNAAEIIRSLVWDGILDYGCGGGHPTMEDGSSCDFGKEDVAKFITENLGTVVRGDNYGRPYEFDLTRSNLVSE